MSEHEPVFSRRGRLAMAVAVLAAVAIAGIALWPTLRGTHASHAAAKSSPPKSFELNGHVSLPVNFTGTQLVNKDHVLQGPCLVPDGYDDIDAGTQVVVTDASGKTLAIGQLAAGELTGVEGQSMASTRCSFAFSVADVPTGQKFYGIEVGHRGSLQYKEADLRAGDLELTLG